MKSGKGAPVSVGPTVTLPFTRSIVSRVPLPPVAGDERVPLSTKATLPLSAPRSSGWPTQRDRAGVEVHGSHLASLGHPRVERAVDVEVEIRGPVAEVADGGDAARRGSTGDQRARAVRGVGRGDPVEDAGARVDREARQADGRLARRS